MDTVKYLLKKNPSAVKKVPGQRSVLMAAVESGSLDVVKYLVEKLNADECEVSIVDETVQKYYKYPFSYRGYTFLGSVLHGAAKNGRLDVLKYFIDERKMNVDVPCSSINSHPLVFIALKYQHHNIFNYLTVEKNADLTVLDEYEENILFEVVRSDQLNVIKYVLDERKIKLNVNQKNKGNETVVHLSVRYDRMSILDYLVNQKHADINFVDGSNTPLHYASWDNHFKAVQLLVEHGADINRRDKNGDTALHLTTSETVLKYLLQKGADINKRNKAGATPLHAAVSRNRYKFCKLLVEKGADINEQNKIGETALHLAVSPGFFEICNYLVEHKADVNVENKRGETPLHYAILKGNNAVCKYLIDHDADVSVDADGTAVHLAATLNEVDILRYLVDEKHANVNATRKRDSWSPLHSAAYYGSYDALKYLIEHGANAQAKDKYGKTPSQIALKENIVAYLNSTASIPRSRRSVIASSMTFPLSYDCRRQKIIGDESRSWSVNRSNGDLSPALWSGDLAPQLQNLFTLCLMMIRKVKQGFVFDTIERSLQNAIDLVAENAINALPTFENERFI